MPASKNRYSTWWLVPVATCVLAAAAAGWSALEVRNLEQGLDRILRAHVDSVSRLVSEGLRQTTEALDALEASREAELLSRRVLSDGPADPPLLALLEEGPTGLRTLRGSLADDRLSRVQQGLASGAETFDLEDATSCAVHGAAPARQVACWDDPAYRELRTHTGLGPLLREMTGPRVRHVAIQDQGGILAASAGAGALSRWSDEPLLARAQAGEAAFRREPGLVEFLGPFQLPDGTTAVLRVGIDSGALDALLEGARNRNRLLQAVLAALSLGSLAAAFLLRRHDRRLATLSQRVEAQERQAAHWREVGLLAAEVAHEVRNPLSTVKMVGQRLRREFEVGEADRAEFEELVALMGKEAARVEGVVSDFLDLSRTLRLEPREQELASLLAEIEPPLRLRAEAEGKRLSIDGGTDLRVRADGKRLYQVLMNLAGNALDALEPGGSVRIVARRLDDGVELRVEDDGPGLDPSALARVQSPFQTSKPQGTGLGLALTRRLVEAHGGTFRLESEPGKGTRATLWLPREAPIREGGE